MGRHEKLEEWKRKGLACPAGSQWRWDSEDVAGSSENGRSKQTSEMETNGAASKGWGCEVRGWDWELEEGGPSHA